MSEHSRKKVEDLKKMLEGKKLDHGPWTVDQGPIENEETVSGDLAELQTKLEAMEEEAKKNHEKLLRTLADFENYKKRITRETQDFAKYSHESLVKELLPVIDDFDRILEHLPAESSAAIQSLTDGVQLTHRHFMTVLKKLGLHQLETAGKKFDPHFHEALSQIASENHDEGEIISCERKGYLLHDRLIRPALVVVAGPKLQ